MATYTNEYSQYPQKIYELHNFRAITDDDASLVNTIKKYIEEKDYAKAQYYIEQNKDSLAQIAIDANYINALEEELRNLEIYCSYNKQTIYTTYDEPYQAKVCDIWVHGGKEREEDPKTYLYGVEWAGGNSTKLTRTDDAQFFEDPSPAIGLGLGSSPFDRLMPWKGMTVIHDSKAGELVKIPKFWYKWTKTGNKLKLQISSRKLDGFFVSPAHADRFGRRNDKDYVYIGRYHSNNKNYMSESGLVPIEATTIASLRDQLTFGGEYYMQDYAMYWTIRMLYLVEFANWNVRETIGIGDGQNNNTPYITGATAFMNYHTGTLASYRNRPGSTSYRYIEDLWGSVYDFVDGISYSDNNIYLTRNPMDNMSGSNKTLICPRLNASGYISAWNVPNVEGFEYAIFPSAVAGTDSSFVSDYYQYTSITGDVGEILAVGGYYNGTNDGLFTMIGLKEDDAMPGVGARIMKI